MDKRKETYEWLTKAYSGFVGKKWLKDPVIRSYEIPNREYYSKGRQYDGTIEPQNIVGLDYVGSYNCTGSEGYTWEIHLPYLKRLKAVRDSFKTKDEIIQHINEDHGPGETKCVLKFGEQLIIVSGQHRLCLAKFLELPSVDDVFITEYEFNTHEFEREQAMKQLEPKLKELNLDEFIRNPDRTFEEAIVSFKHDYTWVRKDLIKTVIRRYEKIKRSKLRRLFLCVKTYFVYVPNKIESEKQLKDLDQVLVKIAKHNSRLSNYQ